MPRAPLSSLLGGKPMTDVSSRSSGRSSPKPPKPPKKAKPSLISQKGAPPKQSGKKQAMLVGGFLVCVLYFAGLYVIVFTGEFSVKYDRADAQALASSSSNSASSTVASATPVLAPINIADYNMRILANANEPVARVSSSTATSTASTTPAVKHLWPVKTVYPEAGALLPYNRIVAYYGNFYSTQMGVLGKYPPAQMIPMLMGEVAKWQAADPSTPVIPAIDYIAVTAQGSPGADGKYRDRMPDSQIQEALTLASQVHGIVILDIQVGDSTVETEVPLLKQYLEMPNVELALDPEFAMHNGAKPGTVIGSLDATDINFASNYLAQLVQANNLPPKILVVHRFTEDMVTRYQDITPLPQVQIVMDMDGWGSQAKKLNTYQQVIEDEPVQFTGFKLFYVNDLRPPSTGMLTDAQLLKLTPIPLFIQYQ
jgi:hypothetical protein